MLLLLLLLLLLRVSPACTRCVSRAARAGGCHGGCGAGKELSLPSCWLLLAAPKPGGWVACLGFIQHKQLVLFLLLPGVGCSFLPHKTMPFFKNKEIIKYI